MGKKKIKLEGNLISELKQLKDCFKINKFQWTTEKINLNLNGKFFNDNTVSVNLYTQGDIEEILSPILKDLSIKGFIYSYSQINKDKTDCQRKIQVPVIFFGRRGIYFSEWQNQLG